MTRDSASATGVPPSLRRLRLRLTAWYVGTLLVILLVLGIGLFATITRMFDTGLDTSLADAAHRLAAMAHTRGVAAASTELVIPGRELLVLDSAGNAVDHRAAAPWIRDLAARATPKGERGTDHREDGTILRGYALSFTAPDGGRYVAMTVADEIEVEDKYTTLIVVTAASALVALCLVGVGGWTVARQSTDPVERAVTNMRRFMADAAHELRTPLTVIRSRAEIALRHPRDREAYEEALRGVERESIRVGKIVEDLLTLARADAGERPIERRRVFLDDVALDAADAARALADRKAVRLDVGELEEAPVTGDAALLRQLVLILLDNAIKFSHEAGSVLLDVRRSAGTTVLTVTDEGVGIPREQLPHVVERFYRSDTARTRGVSSISEGAGLGLSIAQWVVDEHGAIMKIESDPARGTCVTLRFPTAVPDAASSS